MQRKWSVPNVLVNNELLSITANEAAVLTRFKLFVYRTLRQGESRHAALEQAARKFPGEYFLNGFKLVALEEYPAILPSPMQGKNIVGELYEVDDPDGHVLEQLDDIEGVSSGLYSREVVTAVSTDGHEFHGVFAYVGGAGIQADDYPEIVSGDWFDHDIE